jgi:MFS family permease
MNAPWQLDLLWGVVVGSATGAVSVPLAATVATRWFASRRGFVTGILTASNASGQMIFLPVLAVLATNYGWRYAALTVAAVAMLLVFPIVALFVRDRPQSVGLEPYGATEPVAVPERSPRPFRPAIDALLLGMKSRTFWLLVATFFICGLSTNGLIGTHLIPAAVDHHMTAVAGASLLALMGVFDMFGLERAGVVFAWVFASHQLGAAFAAWVAGASRGWFGSYTFAFLSAGALCLLAAALSLRIGRPERQSVPVVIVPA